jgi:ribose 5-phosphate isomerase RpiB
MKLEEVDVEQIVRTVLARLQKRERKTENGAKTLTIRGRLVTEQDLIGQLGDERVVRVQKKTVITPSAREYLADRGIAIEVLDGPRQKETKTEAPLVAVGVAATRFEPGGMLADLARKGVRLQQLARVGLVGVVGELAERVARNGERGILFTDQETAALCLANRVRGIRAAISRSHGEVQEVLNEIGANLLIVGPAKTAPHTMRQIVQIWCSAPVAECPSELRERLG